MIDHDALIARATKAHRLHCYRMGLEPQQPCCARSNVEEDGGAIMVVLRNVNGTLATYHYQAERDRLTLIEKESVKTTTPGSGLRRRIDKEVDLAAVSLEDFVGHGRGVDAESAAEIEARYPLADLGPYTDFEWGMLSGKLSALRWVQGFEWDMLDT
jgi:hypothetical protein